MGTTKKQPGKIGANIRAARERAGLTQLELGHRIGCTGGEAGSQISRFESGKNEPHLTTLAKIAYALDTPLSSLLEGYSVFSKKKPQ